MRHLEACMIAIGAISTEHIDFESLLEGLQIFNLRPYDLPKCFDVSFQRIGFRQVRLKMPSIVAPGGRTRPMKFTLPMEVRWFDGKPFTDLLERDAVTVDAQRRAEAKVIRFVGLFAVEEAPQRAKHFGWTGVIHRDITTKLSRRGTR
jgi:hypothetical protein